MIEDAVYDESRVLYLPNLEVEVLMSVVLLGERTKKFVPADGFFSDCASNRLTGQDYQGCTNFYANL